MRIMHITFSLLNAGKENILIDLANEQWAMGHNVKILIINNKIDEELVERIIKGIQVVRIQRPASGKSLFPLIKLISMIWLIKPEIIHAHDHHIATILYYLTKIPMVLTIHGPGLNTKPMKYYKQLFAISRSIKKDVEDRCDLKCKVIYNGVKTTKIKKRIDGKFLNEFKVIMVKRLNHERKGQDILIKAADILINKKGIKYLKFHLVGDGNSRDYLNNLISEFNLDQSVFLLGNKNRDWVYRNLYRYDLFVHPSRYEGFGLSVTEAMAAKLPVIASNIEGPAEILAHGEYGLLFESDNIDDLVDRIIRAISMYDNGEMESVVEKAYTHCIQNFDIKKTAQSYCNAYLSY